MLGKQVEKLADLLVEQEHCCVEERDIVLYGLSSAIELAVNILSTILLGVLFGMVAESLIFLVAFSLVRTYAGGYHARTAGQCYLFSMFIVLAVLVM